MAFHVEKLNRSHRVDDFDCGSPPLNSWLQQYALPNQFAQTSNTYLAMQEDAVVGYYSLAASRVLHDDAPERLRKGISRHPIPLMLLARLAVDLRWRSIGVGAALIKDAIRRTLQAADIAGIRALEVNAKDEQAVAFYSHFNFVPSPTDPLHLFCLLKDLRSQLQL